MDWALAVGILGVLISAATLWFVLLDRAERRRTMRRVSWSFSVTSTVHETANGRREHTATVLRLTNSGGSSGQIQASTLIGATVIATDNPLVPATVLPGSHHDFKIEPADHSKVWLLLVYTDSSDMRYVHAMWVPLDPIGSLATEYYAERSRYSRWWKRFWRQHSKGVVGPGGKPYRSVKSMNAKKIGSFLGSAAPAIFDGSGTRIHC